MEQERLEEQLTLFLVNYEQRIKKITEELRQCDMPPLTEELFSRFEQDGNRLAYENIYFLRRKYLAAFGMLSVLEKRSEDISYLEKVLISICEEECWALPAHVNRKKNKNWNITIDLFAAETAQTISELCYLLKEELSEECFSKVKTEVERRVFEPFYQSKVPYAFWETSKDNWNAVCTGAIGSASIYWMQDTPKRLERCLERIVNALTNYFKGFGEDGVCMEGLDYYTYGMTYYTGFAAQLKEYSKGNIDLLANEKMKKIAAFYQSCFFEGGRTISFSDGSKDSYFKMGLACFLAQNFEGVNVPNLKMAGTFDSDPCFRFMACYRDVIWTREYLKSHPSKTSAFKNVTVFPVSQWCICQGRFQSGMAVKGGTNQEPHNHNDVGSFLYVLGSDMLLADLGAGEYTADYFGEKRYDIFCNSSFSHNIPIIFRMGQGVGEKYRCKEFIADGLGNVKMRLEGAYPILEPITFWRALSFDADTGCLLVEDTFSANEGQKMSVIENLVTQYPIEIFENTIRIQGKETACKIQIQSDCADILKSQVLHKNHQGQQEMVTCIRWKKEWISLKKEKEIIRFRIEPEEKR